MSESQILFLDEPTAALDAFGEAALYDRFAQLTENKTVIFISHRFSTVRMADTIVVLENARIIEQSDHETLMALDGKYRLMFTTQAERYAKWNNCSNLWIELGDQAQHVGSDTNSQWIAFS